MRIRFGCVFVQMFEQFHSPLFRKLNISDMIKSGSIRKRSFPHFTFQYRVFISIMPDPRCNTSLGFIRTMVSNRVKHKVKSMLRKYEPCAAICLKIKVKKLVNVRRQEAMHPPCGEITFHSEEFCEEM